MADEGPFSLDMTTSLTNWNRINEARRVGRPIPDNWACDEQGRFVTDPASVYSLAPAAGYKGFGLGMMVEILCALLTGGSIGKDIPGMYVAPLDTHRDLSHFFMTIYIEKFIAIDVFKRRLQDMVNRIRALPRAPGADADVMVPGDPEKRAADVRRVKGIPIDEAKFTEFLELSLDFERARVPQ